jgi:hypothetical protein
MASGPVFMFCAHELVFDGTEGIGSRFQVLFSQTSFQWSVCVGSCFHVLRARTHFWRYRGRRVPFSCFARPDSFSTVPIASGPILTICAIGHIFGGAECVGSCFHVLRARIRFRWYRRRRVPFSCFSLRDSFSAVPRESCPVFMFCGFGLVFGGTEGVGSRFQVLCARTRFRCRRVCRAPFSRFAQPDSFLLVPFSSFALPDSFSAVPSASGPVFTFCMPVLVFSGTDGVGSHFHVLRSRTRFRRYRGRWDPFSSFARPDTFSAVPRASGPVFMFCAPGLVLGGPEGVGSRFQVLRSRTHFRR